MRNMNISKMQDPLSREVIIVNELGLHARSAAKIAAIASHAESQVTISKGDEIVDAKSIIDMLTLACGKGMRITINVDSDADVEILSKIAELVENGFGE
ncbi:HPr family phosphocarrier protein [Desulfococcus multivorans]|uniref:Phosphotransferase system, phosphocarrier protein HPr n=2 Tax=Desulfococcus multivorans TaxID=897 RepID=S7TY27_DESML|nr:HPr family phosphocarrier protein [Desulfococcus multivorans]EPR42036.1 Phosphotransferase system, phosphocarrier protein HPr [Desulfococcus multivorans DSM 2059]SKA09839.1 phosphocarrier protein [Desulfococcus multivorans DSM 2059]